LEQYLLSMRERLADVGLLTKFGNTDVALGVIISVILVLRGALKKPCVDIRK